VSGAEPRAFTLPRLPTKSLNFIEGMLDHELLGIHHVHPGAGQLGWDLGVLAVALLQIAAGWRSIRAAEAESHREP
jgi:uncharacterized membrane protein